jgi:hypothetical protein
VRPSGTNGRWKTPTWQAGLESPQVARRPAGRESPDNLRVGPIPHESALVTKREERDDPRKRVRERERLALRCDARRRTTTGRTAHAAVARPPQRNPTAVQSGNRQATPLGERSRRKLSRHEPSVRRGSPLTLRAERAEAGPGRELLAEKIGPIPEQAHAVTSRVTSWAFWFSFLFPPSHGRERAGRSIED